MKKSKLLRSLSMLIALLMVLSTLTLLPITASAEGEFVPVNTAQGLNEALAANSNVKLTADIDFNGVTWTQVSNYSGIFDGAGYAIKNLKLSKTGNWHGMFYNLNGATVKNLYLHACTDTSITGQFMALLSCVANGTNTIENVCVAGEVSTTTYTAGNYHAGFIAQVQSGVTNIIGCESKVTVKENKINAGFVAGVDYDADLNMTDCVFSGNLSQCNGTETCAFVGRVSGDITLKRCIKLGNSCDNAGQWRGAFVFLDASNLGSTTEYTGSNYTAPTVTLEDCYTTANVDNITVIASHTGNPNRGDGKFNVSIVYDGEETYSYDAATGSSELLYVETKGKIKILTSENFATVYPNFSNWVVTNDTVTYGSKTITRVTPKGIYEMEMAAMEETVNAAVFGDNQYIQYKANAKDATATDVRLVTSITGTDYDMVGYLVSTVEADVTAFNGVDGIVTATKTVFTSILVNGTPVEADGDYWLALGINGIPASAADTTIYVRPYTIKGGALTLGNVSSFTLNSVKASVQG
ncbi:MAG: hypothetical protein IJZ80_07035 [Clostridia bacterium]|nr:hypothetical protein [Clostridia bacterium]